MNGIEQPMHESQGEKTALSFEKKFYDRGGDGVGVVDGHLGTGSFLCKKQLVPINPRSKCESACSAE